LPAHRGLLTRTGYADDVTGLAAHRLPTPVPPLDLQARTARPDIRQLRVGFDEWLDALDPAESDRVALELAVWDAVANAVDHAYPPGRPGPVRLQAALGADGVLECRISDRGRWRDPDPTIASRHGQPADQPADRLRSFSRWPPRSSGCASPGRWPIPSSTNARCS
jgi:anti-sigma regulatory factor (Ser/Thr protein kinase)